MYCSVVYVDVDVPRFVNDEGNRRQSGNISYFFEMISSSFIPLRETTTVVTIHSFIRVRSVGRVDGLLLFFLTLYTHDNSQ